jgi:hypothetical protein
MATILTRAIHDIGLKMPTHPRGVVAAALPASAVHITRNFREILVRDSLGARAGR